MGLDQGRAYKGLSDSYRKTRPGYPVEIGRAIVQFAGSALEGRDAIAVDVGAGTGISTVAVREALPPGCLVVGVEPNDEMRRAAAAAVRDDSRMSFIGGSAEELPIADGRAVLVTAGQAVQWFDRPRFYSEACRVLAVAGVLGLFENNRDWRSSPLLDEHEAFLEEYSVRDDGTRYSRCYRIHPYAQELFDYFGNVTARRVDWIRRMSVDEFVHMAESSTQARPALLRLGRTQGLAMIRAYAERHADERGSLQVHYNTALYLARKETAHPDKDGAR